MFCGGAEGYGGGTEGYGGGTEGYGEEARRGMEEARRGMGRRHGGVWGEGTEGYGGGTKGYGEEAWRGMEEAQRGIQVITCVNIGSLVCRSRLQHRPLTPPTHLSSPRTAKSLLGVDTSPLQWNEEQHWLWLCH